MVAPKSIRLAAIAAGETIVFKGVVESVDEQAGTANLDMWVESGTGKTVTAKAVLGL